MRGGRQAAGSEHEAADKSLGKRTGCGPRRRGRWGRVPLVLYLHVVTQRLQAAVLRRPGSLLSSCGLLCGAHSPLAQQVQQLKVGHLARVAFHYVV